MSDFTSQSHFTVVLAVTWFTVAVMPGMCMTLAMTLSASLGIRKTLWMVAGELLGVGTVALTALLGVAAALLTEPKILTLVKGLGALYLLYLGLQFWRTPNQAPLAETAATETVSVGLMSQGFVTAIANPKGWAFTIALLPPFIVETQPLSQQVMTLIAIVLLMEFISLMLYCFFGRLLSRVLGSAGGARFINRVAGILMVGIAVSLAWV